MQAQHLTLSGTDANSDFGKGTTRLKISMTTILFLFIATISHRPFEISPMLGTEMH